jgi:flagellar hook protein FlgE
MPNFSIPLSGLDASSAALSTAANNLANLNTTGYKDQQIQFSDLFYQNLGTNGAGDPIQQGAGVQVSSQPSNYTQGDVTATGTDTDVAINGNGFFVVQQNGVQTYTRAGNFEVGTDNLLETGGGQQVMGYAATNGVISTSAGLSTLALGAGTSSPAAATKNISMTTNLNATDVDGTYSTQATIYDSLGAVHQLTVTYTNLDAPAVPAKAATGVLTATVNPVATQSVLIGGQTYTFTATAPPGAGSNDVYIGATAAITMANLVNAINDNYADAAGTATPGGYGTTTALNPNVTAVDNDNGSITVTADVAGTTGFTTGSSGVGDTNLTWGAGAGTNGAAATAAVINTWGYSVSIPSTDLNAVAGVPQTGILQTGTLTFDGNGNLISDTIGPLGTPNTPAVNITAIPITGFTDGASDMTFNWNLLNGKTPVITQLAAANSTADIQQDGTSSGTLQKFSIRSDGTITGSFSNGTTAILGQIALASFADEQGLSRNGNNDYSPTLASGQPTVGAPTSGGLGSISGGALEASNVDIATEFANLIVAQRTYEANARVVTTFDTIAQDTIALKQ